MTYGSYGSQTASRAGRSLRHLGALGLLMLLGAGTALAQGRIQGRVTDAADGEPLPGANISLVEAPTRGAVSAGNGSYLIPSIPAGNYTVRATYLGYRTFERRVTVTSSGIVNLDIAMTEGEVQLEDFVVTGYGVEIKRLETGASSTINADEFRTAPVQNAEQALQGRAAGVQITSVSGAPGAGVVIRVRGIGSLNAGTDPLYIIDGVQVRSGSLTSQAQGNLLNSLNPADIETIEILKDAAAVAIYGAQAANGVVLITTKRGREGPTQVEVASELGQVERFNTFDVLTGPEYANLLVMAARNRANYLGQAYGVPQAKATLFTGINNGASSVIFDTTGIGTSQAALDQRIAGLPTYDWQDAVQRENGGVRRKATVSLNGGVRNTRFFLSGGAEYNEGSVLKSDFDRLSFRANLDHRPTRKVGLETSVGVTRTSQFGTIANGNFINGPFFQPARQRPTDPIFAADGVAYNNPLRGNYNIVQGLNLEERENRALQVVGSVRSTYQILTNLILSGLAGVDATTLRDHNFRPPEIPVFAGTSGSGFEASREAYNFNTNATLNYLKSFGEHSVNTLIGTEYKREYSEQFTASATGFPSGLFTTLNSAATPTGATGFQTENRTASLFSQLKYDFDNKYFLTGSLRYDGSSRFGQDTRFGLFPSVSAAWDVARESFMRDGLFDEFKLRASYGITGNSDVGDFASRNLFARGGSYRGVSGVRQSQLGNPNLGWEESEQLDLGVDFSLFDTRVAGTFEYFNKESSDLLLPRPLFEDAGVNSVTENVGSINNRGVEFELRTLNFARGGFEWRTDLNLSRITNEITSLLPDQDTLLSFNYFVGQPRGVYYIQRYAGVNPADGRPMYYDRNGNITYSPTSRDLNVEGDVVPDFFGGVSNRFSYRGLALDVFFQFNVGQETFLQNEGFFLFDPSRGDNVDRRLLERSWSGPGDVDAEYPVIINSTNLPGSSNFYTTSSTRLLEDASYARLKTVTLSYNLPRALLRTARMRQAQLYLTGWNLATWTAFDGIDPELVGTSNAPYPQTRQYTLGVSLSF